jgi:hypothetical protein
MMEAGSTLEEISQEIFERFPNSFADVQQALNHVGKLSLKYSK